MTFSSIPTPGSRPRSQAFRVGPWRVDPELNAATSEGRTRRLGPTLVALWVALVRRAGRLVSKDELVAEAWNGHHVTDDAVTVAVYELRKLLGDKARAPRYIETIPGRGYRWLVPVEWEEAGASSPPLDPTRPQADRVGEESAEAAKTDEADGSAGRLTAGEDVPPRESLVSLEATISPPGLRREDRVRRWRRLGAVAVTLVLGLVGVWWALGGQQKHAEAVESPELSGAALDAYVRGLVHLRKQTPEGATLALEALREATELAPGHGRAWAALAETHAQQIELGLAISPGLLQRARTTATHAVALQPDHVGALYSMGLVELLSFDRWPLAESWFERALALDPTAGRCWQGLTWVLLAQGRTAEAAEAARRGLLLAPDNLGAVTAMALIHFLEGRPEQGLETLTTARERGLPFQAGQLTLQATIETHLGELDAAAETTAAILVVLGRPPEEVSRLGSIHAEHGFDAMLRHFLETTPELSEPTRALRWVYLDEIEEALRALEAGAVGRDPEMFVVAAYPGLRALDGEPRYERILVELGLTKP